MTVTAPASLLTAENQAVMENYYDHTNVGDFLGATQFLSDDVVYRIPGPPSIVAYSGEWVGKERVVQLFQAFNSAFSLVDMVETRTVTSPSEVLSINDEIFVARGTGRPWRVGVVHHMKFRNGKIYSLTNYTDIVPAIQALAGRNATEIPMLPSDLFAGESSVPSEEAAKVIGRYYEQFPNVDDLVNDDVTALMPGDPRRLRWSGKWSGRREFLQMCSSFSSTLQVEKRTVSQILANNGSVAATVRLQGRSTASQASFDFEAVEFFQISGEKKISRLTSFFDTYRVTGAA